MWDVVIWENGNTVDFLPSSWRVNERTDLYLWPKKMSHSKLMKLLKEGAPPDMQISYTECAATCKATVEKIELAEELVEKLQFNTDLSNDEEVSPIEHEVSPIEHEQQTSEDEGSEKEKNALTSLTDAVSKCLKVTASTNYDIKDIKKHISQIEASVALICDTMIKNHSSDSQIHQKFASLPLESEEDLMSLEKNLEDSDHYDKMVKTLSIVTSSKDVKKCTHIILKRLLSKELSLQYSALGKKGKKNFSKLKAYHLVIDVVRKHIPDATEDVIRSHVSSCLAQAGDRDGGRKSRPSIQVP